MLKAQADGVSVSPFHQRNLISAKMTIETKFSLFDKAYTMCDNKVYSFEVEKIHISVIPKKAGDKFCKPEIDVIYYDYECQHWFNECDCYASKEELIASL